LNFSCSTVFAGSNLVQVFTMSESPTYSDPEKDAHVSDEKKAAFSSDTPVYGDEATEETDAVEFGEVKDLR
jgi:hypothetical protein